MPLGKLRVCVCVCVYGGGVVLHVPLVAQTPLTRDTHTHTHTHTHQEGKLLSVRSQTRTGLKQNNSMSLIPAAYPMEDILKITPTLTHFLLKGVL
jgi:hypothetical protein